MSKKTKTAKKEKAFKVDLSITGIKEFISFASEFKVSSLSLGQKDKKITITKNINAPAPVAKSAEAVAEVEFKPESYEKIKSKYIGSFHLGKGVAVGKPVKKGQVVAKIGSMKMEHDIKAEKDCTIKEILVKEKASVDFGKPLFFIE